MLSSCDESLQIEQIGGDDSALAANSFSKRSKSSRLMPRSLPLIVEFVTSEIEEHSFTSCLMASTECGTEGNSGCTGVVVVVVVETTVGFGFGFGVRFGFGFGLVVPAFVAVEAGLETVIAFSARGESIAWFVEDGGHRMGANAARRGD